MSPFLFGYLGDMQGAVAKQQFQVNTQREQEKALAVFLCMAVCIYLDAQMHKVRAVQSESLKTRIQI